MKASHLSAILFVTIGLAACGETSKQQAEAPAQVATAPAAPVDNLVKNVVADAVPFQPEAAKVDGNALVSTGVAGFIMYGPYVPFVPGAYRVTVKGSIPELRNGAQVDFDVVSNTGKTIHGVHVVTTIIPTSGDIAEFDVTIPEGVTDLELRANVTDGADVRIESYQITKAN